MIIVKKDTIQLEQDVKQQSEMCQLIEAELDEMISKPEVALNKVILFLIYRTFQISHYKKKWPMKGREYTSFLRQKSTNGVRAYIYISGFKGGGKVYSSYHHCAY